MINHGNAIISSYGTNFKYIANDYDTYFSLTRTQAITYDDNCSCALNANCTTQARFTKINSSETILVKGLKIGCTPSESFLLSTLECLYDSSCIYLINEQMQSINKAPVWNVSIPLSNSNSRFFINSTISTLLDHLFVETWSNMINYSSYFERCAPYMCSYTYIQQINSIYTVTLLLGLSGGLSLVLKWLSPWIIQYVVKLLEYRDKRRNRIHHSQTTMLPG